MENSELPENWTQLPFPEAAQRVRSTGSKVKAGEYNATGRIPVVDQGQKLVVGFTDNESAKFQGPLPVIVFGDHTREVKFVDFDFAVGADGTVLLRPDSAIEPRFFYYWLQSASLHHLGYSRHYKLLAEQFVRFPKSRTEQRRVVGRVEALTVRLDQARQARQAALVEAQIIELAYLEKIRREGDRKSWPTVRLGEIATVIMGQSPKGDTYNLNGDGMPLLNGPTEFGEEHPTPRQWTTNPQRLCAKGDILFCVRGSTTGRMNWADGTYCLGRGLAAIRPKPSTCLPIYLYGFLKTQAAEILHHGEGGVFPNFNKDQLQAMPIVLPSIEEQKKTVSVLRQLGQTLTELQRLQREVEAELASFTPALLAKAFRGEL